MTASPPVAPPRPVRLLRLAAVIAPVMLLLALIAAPAAQAEAARLDGSLTYRLRLTGPIPPSLVAGIRRASLLHVNQGRRLPSALALNRLIERDLMGTLPLHLARAGYPRAWVDAARGEPTADGVQTIVLRIDPGPAWHFARGTQLVTDPPWLHHVGGNPGEAFYPLDSGRMVADLDRLHDALAEALYAARTAGFARAMVTQLDMHSDDTTRTISVTARLALGPRLP